MNSETHNPFTLQGKTVLVTGASSGIGRAIAVECSRMGAALVITARNEARLKETLESLDGDGHRMICADLTVEEDIESLVAQLPELDGMAECAGRSIIATLKFAKREKLDDVFNINFFSQIELIRLVYKKKLLRKGSSVVVISSIGGNYRCTPGNMIYGASKAALQTAVRYLACELGPKTRVNSICPGMVETPLIHSGNLTQEQLEKDMAYYPMKRYGMPQDVAFGAVYLLSDAAAWVTGHGLVIDGGCTAR